MLKSTNDFINLSRQIEQENKHPRCLMPSFYITTTLPYANAEPHIGHALEFVQADAYARYYRKTGQNVIFNVGLDEHGLKLYEAAQKEEMTPPVFLDRIKKKWDRFCEQFKITNDLFYRTSSRDHHQGAQAIWKRCDEHGDIYKKHYSGKYCVGCEAFLIPKDIVDGKCPKHNLHLREVSEENYFFRLSRYRDDLVKHLESNALFLQPASMRQELINFVKNMDDISISRSKKNLPWGVDVPSDPDHVMYVWFDALTNYILAVGYGDENRAGAFEDAWPGIQICGQDNLRFQGAIWQGILASLGLPFSKNLLVHGTILDENGQKMSKTVGNVISPALQADKYGVDACRFYLLGVLRTYSNSNYSEKELEASYNAFLANGFGNLVNRIVHLMLKFEIPFPEQVDVSDDFQIRVTEANAAVAKAFQKFDLHQGVQEIQKAVSDANQYLHDSEPWKLDGARAKKIVQDVAYLSYAIADLLEPYIPIGAELAKNALNKRIKTVIYPRIG